MKKHSTLFVVIGLMFGASGCTHSMQIKNLDQYVKHASAMRPLNVTLKSETDAADGDQLFSFVHEALAVHPGIGKVALSGQEPPGFTPDLTITVAPKPEYHGSGWNYLITFPGFLLFTHAWNGFVYSADVKTDITLTTPGTTGTTATVETVYNLRHCDVGRGMWTSSGWYTPGYGGLNAVIGFFMIPYDPDSTPEFLKEVRSAYGQYLANSIIEMANGRQVAYEPPASATELCIYPMPAGDAEMPSI